MQTLSTRVTMLAGVLGLVAALALMLREAGREAAPPAPPLPAEVTPMAPPPPPPPRQVVALRDIPRGAVIPADALGLAVLDPAPAGAATRPEEIAGRLALERIGRGEAPLPHQLSAAGEAPGLSPLVPPGLRAVTLRVAEDTGVAFLIRPGDFVDVALATRGPAEGAAPRQGPPNFARVVLEDVAVLAVAEALSPEGAARPDAARPGPPPQRTVTIAARPEDVPRLGLLRADGGFFLALRNPGDRTRAAGAPTLREEMLAMEAPPAPSPPPAAAPRPVRAGPEILRGPAR